MYDNSFWRQILGRVSGITFFTTINIFVNLPFYRALGVKAKLKCAAEGFSTKLIQKIEQIEINLKKEKHFLLVYTRVNSLTMSWFLVSRSHSLIDIPAERRFLPLGLTVTLLIWCFPPFHLLQFIKENNGLKTKC